MKRRFRPQIEPMEGRVVPSTFTVTNNRSDFVAGSLSYAVWQSNTTPGLDTINFATAGTITVASTLELADSVTLSGPGVTSMTLDGGYLHRILQIDPGVNATISGLWFTRGGSNDNGGAILDYGGLNLVGDLFTVNLARNTGGAVAVAPGAWCVSQYCIFSQNYAGYGGGAIADFGGVRDIGSTFYGNYTNNVGGAVYNAGGFDFQGSTFTSNHTILAGGGVYDAAGAWATFAGITWNNNLPDNFNHA